MKNEIKLIIKNHWRQMVDSAYFYRGMSLNDLNLNSTSVLDPNSNLHQNLIPHFIEYSELLLQLITKGLKFEVKDFYVEPLEKILLWTVRDLKNPGIDFTTNYADAVSYAFNYAGSQVKHNFNIITRTINDCGNQPYFSVKEKRQLLKLTKKIKELISTDINVNHKPVVLKVKRSCPAFQNYSVKELNIGAYEFFLKRALKRASDCDANTKEKIAFFLHQQSQQTNFNISLIRPLHKNNIEEIIEL